MTTFRGDVTVRNKSVIWLMETYFLNSEINDINEDYCQQMRKKFGVQIALPNSAVIEANPP